MTEKHKIGYKMKVFYYIIIIIKEKDVTLHYEKDSINYLLILFC